MVVVMVVVVVGLIWQILVGPILNSDKHTADS